MKRRGTFASPGASRVARLARARLRLAAALAALLAALTACAGDPEPSPSAAVPAPAPAPAPTASPTPPYDRDDWDGGWADADGDCQNTRAETLIIESLVEVGLDDCRVVSGLWADIWTGERFLSASALHIDHHVSLRNAHVSGGGGWDAARRARFFNDLDNLNAIGAGTNLEKGARGPSQWRPPLRASWRQYAEQWIAVKEKHGLSFTPAERQALDEMLAPP